MTDVQKEINEIIEFGEAALRDGMSFSFYIKQMMEHAYKLRELMDD